MFSVIHLRIIICLIFRCEYGTVGIKSALIADLKNYDGGIELRGWLDELFGDG